MCPNWRYRLQTLWNLTMSSGKFEKVFCGQNRVFGITPASSICSDERRKEDGRGGEKKGRFSQWSKTTFMRRLKKKKVSKPQLIVRLGKFEAHTYLYMVACTNFRKQSITSSSNNPRRNWQHFWFSPCMILVWLIANKTLAISSKHSWIHWVKHSFGTEAVVIVRNRHIASSSAVFFFFFFSVCTPTEKKATWFSRNIIYYDKLKDLG